MAELQQLESVQEVESQLNHMTAIRELASAKGDANDLARKLKVF